MRVDYAEDEEALIVELRRNTGYHGKKFTKRLTEALPGRSKRALQERYSTKLKDRAIE